jgi:hypothetical protein
VTRALHGRCPFTDENGTTCGRKLLAADEIRMVDPAWPRAEAVLTITVASWACTWGHKVIEMVGTDTIELQPSYDGEPPR